MKSPAALAAILAAAIAGAAFGQPVGSEFRANTYTTGDQTGVAVAGSSGFFVVVWESDDGSGPGIFGQRFTSTVKPAPLGGQFRVNTSTTGGQSRASVASDASGNFVVVWQTASVDQLTSNVFAQRYSNAGAPLGTEFRVNTYSTVDPPFIQRNPAVSSDPSGNFVIVWVNDSEDGSGYGIFGQRFASTGAPLGGQFRANTYTPFNEKNPAVATAGSGTFVIAWRGFHSPYDHIYAQRYDANGSLLGGEFQVSTYTGHYQDRPTIAADAAGNFVVAWESYNQDAHQFEIYARRYDGAGAPLTPEFRVNTVIQYSQVNPKAASDSTGNVTIVWQGSDSSGQGIYGQRYAATGAPMGGEFIVNSYQTFEQTQPSVGALGAAFVVAWQGPNDGDGSGIFGKRYPGPGDVNGDGVVNVGDVFYLINFLFAGGAPPVGPGDTSGNGVVDVGDVFYLINFLFAGGPTPK